MDSAPRTSRIFARRAFTLIELLVVMAIIVVMIGLVVPAFKTIGAAGRLTAAGNRVVNLINFARQDAMARNAMTALLIVTDPNSLNRNRMLCTLELVPPADGTAPATANWRQAGKWETLEQGIVADQFSLFSASTDTPVSPAFPALTYPGTNTSVAAYNYTVFLPSGVLYSGNTLQLRLVEGLFPSAAASVPTYTHASGGVPVNYYNIYLLGATGRVKLDRK